MQCTRTRAHTSTRTHSNARTRTHARTHMHTCSTHHDCKQRTQKNAHHAPRSSLHTPPHAPSHSTAHKMHDAPPQAPKKQKNPRPPKNQRTKKKQRTDLAKTSMNPLHDTWSAVPIEMIETNDEMKEHAPAWDPQSETPPKLMHVPSHKIKTFMTRTEQRCVLDLSKHNHEAARPQFSQLRGVKALKRLASQTPPLAACERGRISTMNDVVEEKLMLCAQLHAKLMSKTPIKFAKRIDPALHGALRMSCMHPPCLTHNGAKLQLSLPPLNPELPHVAELVNVPTMHVLWTDTGECHAGQSTQPQTGIRTHLRCVKDMQRGITPLAASMLKRFPKENHRTTHVAFAKTTGPVCACPVAILRDIPEELIKQCHESRPNEPRNRTAAILSVSRAAEKFWMTQLKANSVYFNSASNAWMPMPPPRDKRHGLNSEAQATRAVGHQTRKRAIQNHFKKRMHPCSKTKVRLSSGQTHSNCNPLPSPIQLPQPWTNMNMNNDVFATQCYHPASHHMDELPREFFTHAYPNDHDMTERHVKEKKQINPAIPHPNPSTTPNDNDAPPRPCYPPKPWEQAMMSLGKKTVTQMLEFALHTSPFHYPHNGMPTFAVMAHITAQLRRNVHKGKLHETTHQDAPMKEGNNAVTTDFTTPALDWLDTKGLQIGLSKFNTPPSDHLVGLTPQQPKRPHSH